MYKFKEFILFEKTFFKKLMLEKFNMNESERFVYVMVLSETHKLIIKKSKVLNSYMYEPQIYEDCGNGYIQDQKFPAFALAEIPQHYELLEEFLTDIGTTDNLIQHANNIKAKIYK